MGVKSYGLIIEDLQQPRMVEDSAYSSEKVSLMICDQRWEVIPFHRGHRLETSGIW